MIINLVFPATISDWEFLSDCAISLSLPSFTFFAVYFRTSAVLDYSLGNFGLMLNLADLNSRILE